MRGDLAFRFAIVEPYAGHSGAGITLDHDEGNPARANSGQRLPQKRAAPDEHRGVDRRRG